MTDDITQKLGNISRHPSRDAIMFMCSYNNVRRAGNVAAHTAKQEDIRDAVTTTQLETRDRQCLEQIYEFIYDQHV